LRPAHVKAIAKRAAVVLDRIDIDDEGDREDLIALTKDPLATLREDRSTEALLEEIESLLDEADEEDEAERVASRSASTPSSDSVGDAIEANRVAQKADRAEIDTLKKELAATQHKLLLAQRQTHIEIEARAERRAGMIRQFKPTGRFRDLRRRRRRLRRGGVLAQRTGGETGWTGTLPGL
jgi:hypothetical protein